MRTELRVCGHVAWCSAAGQLKSQLRYSQAVGPFAGSLSVHRLEASSGTALWRQCKPTCESHTSLIQ